MSKQQREYTTQSRQKAPWHQRGRWWALAAACLGSLLAVALLVVLLLPPLNSSLQAEIADGQRSFAIENDATTPATITPEAGWSVQPDGEGLLLRSPDRLLVVEISSTNEAPLVSAGALSETLSSGLELRHITEQGYFSGELMTPSGALRVEAHVDSRFDLDQSNTEWSLANYRPALSTLIESVRVP